MAKNNSDSENKNNKNLNKNQNGKGRGAVIGFNIYFSISLVVYAVSAYALCGAFYYSKKDILDYLCLLLFFPVASAGLYYSIRGLIALNKENYDRADVQALSALTLWLGAKIAKVILLTGLLMILAKVALNGPHEIISGFVFILQVELPFLILIAAGIFLIGSIGSLEASKTTKSDKNEVPPKKAENQGKGALGASQEVTLDAEMTDRVGGDSAAKYQRLELAAKTYF